jgi:charged multivesicular body protein 5
MKVLQRRKMYESQKDQLQQQSWNMEQAGMMQDNLKSPLFSYLSFFLAPLLASRAHFWSSVSLSILVALCLPLGRRLLMRKDPGAGTHTDVMVTVDALKTTNKELKKQYGKINIDKSEFTRPSI